MIVSRSSAFQSLFFCDLPRTTSTASVSNLPPTPLDQHPRISIQYLNPQTPPFNPTPPIATDQPPQPAKPRTGGRKKNHPPPPQNLDLEYAKIELNTAQATINVLETTVNDLRFRNGLLEDRVKQLEGIKKSELYEKYFPP